MSAERADRFVSSGGDLILPQCSYCLRRRSSGGVTSCDAFPGGVPTDVLRNRADHRKPVEGDGGLRFEPRPDVPAAELATLGGLLDNGGRSRPAWDRGTHEHG